MFLKRLNYSDRRAVSSTRSAQRGYKPEEVQSLVIRVETESDFIRSSVIPQFGVIFSVEISSLCCSHELYT
jgi:hypothetical protein